MKSKIILLLGLSVLTASCKKITNITLVDGINTGKLSYKLNDDSGKGLVGVKVSIYNLEFGGRNANLDPRALVNTTLTNHDGIAYFTDLLPQAYRVTTDSPIVNQIKYRTEQYVQVVADTEKSRTIKVSEFSGILNIKVTSRDGVSSLENLTVLAFPIDDLKPNANNIQAIIKASNFKGVTDTIGTVSIKIPSNIPYDLVVYNPTNGNINYGDGYYKIDTGEKRFARLFSF